MNELEEKVKDLIKESLRKRIKGLGRIDNIYDNEHLVSSEWLTDIMSLGFNEQDVPAAADDIYEIQVQLMNAGIAPVRSIEDIRARVFLSSNRFADECFAFEKYVKLRDKEPEAAVLNAVKDLLQDIEEGDFVLA